MIEATTPKVIPAINEIVYDVWTIEYIGLTRKGEGICEAIVVVNRAIDNGNDTTTISTDTEDRYTMVIPNIYGSLSETYTEAIRNAIISAAGPIDSVVTLLMINRGVN